MANKLFNLSISYRDLFDSWISDIETNTESSSAYHDNLCVESLIMDNTVYSHPTCAELPKFKAADLTLDEIEITSMPYRTRYFHKNTFDKTGLEVTVKFRNDNSVVIDDYTIEPNGPLEFTDEYVTISYTYGDTTYHATIPITVSGEPVYIVTGTPCYYSEDECESWTSYAAYSGYKTIARIGNLVYAHLPNSNSIYRSDDGTSWESYYIAPLLLIQGLYFGNGIGFAYGCARSNAYRRFPGICYTTDLGQSWVNISAPWTYKLDGNVTVMGIAYGNGKFVAVTNNTYIFSSYDGKTWEVSNSLEGAVFETVVYENGMFIASGNTSYYSYDGETWTSLPGILNDNTIHAVAYGNGRFVGVGDYGRYYYYDPLTMTEWGTGQCQYWDTTQCSGILFHDSVFTVVSSDGKLVETSNGESWSLYSKLPINNYTGIYKP